jgi:hypothetical protein
MPPIVPTGVPDSSRGNSATVTMSREDLMAKTATQLKALLKERGLPAGNATKSTLVDRFLKGKKKAPKSNAERQATHKANRSEAQKEEDRDVNLTHNNNNWAKGPPLRLFLWRISTKRLLQAWITERGSRAFHPQPWLGALLSYRPALKMSAVVCTTVVQTAAASTAGSSCSCRVGITR